MRSGLLVAGALALVGLLGAAGIYYAVLLPAERAESASAAFADVDAGVDLAAEPGLDRAAVAPSGTAAAPEEPEAVEHPEPAFDPETPSSSGAPSEPGAVAVVEGTPDVLRSHVEMDHPPTAEDEFEAANELLAIVSARRERVAAQLADAQRRGDTRAIARFTHEQDLLTRSERQVTGLVSDLESETTEAPADPAVAPSPEPQ